MATHNKTVSITDDDQKILSNDLWDTLGASLILEEAGGTVVDETDNFPSTKSNLLVASSSEIHDEFKNIVFSNIHDELRGRF